MDNQNEKRLIRLDLDGIDKIFWGYLLIFLDFRINNFDLLPDFVGYILIIVGLSRLSYLSDSFDEARIYAWISLILSFLNLFRITNGISEIPGWFWIYYIIGGLIAVVIDILLYNHLISGIQQIAVSCGNEEYADKSQRIFNWLVAVIISNFLFGAIVLFLGENAFTVFLTIALIIFSLAVEIIFLSFLRDVYKTFHGAEVEDRSEENKEET